MSYNFNIGDKVCFIPRNDEGIVVDRNGSGWSKKMTYKIQFESGKIDWMYEEDLVLVQSNQTVSATGPIAKYKIGDKVAYPKHNLEGIIQTVRPPDNFCVNYKYKIKWVDGHTTTEEEPVLFIMSSNITRQPASVSQKCSGLIDQLHQVQASVRHNQEIISQPKLRIQPACECGAIHSSFPNQHSSWCPEVK